MARLGKGEGVGEGPLDGLPPAAVPAVAGPSVARPASAAVSAVSPIVAAVTGSAFPIVAAEDVEDSSGDEAVMTGRPQTGGGGPVDPELLPDVAKKPVAAPPPLLPGPLSARSPINPVPIRPPSNLSQIGSSASPLINTALDPLQLPADS